MKIETKELEKIVKLLQKEGQNLVNISFLPHDHFVKFEFNDSSGHTVEVRIGVHDSGEFSKIIRVERF